MGTGRPQKPGKGRWLPRVFAIVLLRHTRAGSKVLAPIAGCIQKPQTGPPIISLPSNAPIIRGLHRNLSGFGMFFSFFAREGDRPTPEPFGVASVRFQVVAA